MFKNPPSNAGDAGSITGWETEIPHGLGQLNPPAVGRTLVLQQRPSAAKLKKKKKKKPAFSVVSVAVCLVISE